MSNDTNTTHKIFSSRLKISANVYVGESGRIFYHEDTGELRLSDGVTPGGLPVAGGSGGTVTLTGDITGSGTSSITTTLSTVNANVGSFGNSSYIPTITVNNKGLITGISINPVGGASSSILLDGDVTAIGLTGSNTTVTFNTVNGNIGTFGNSAYIPTITVNEKGLITAVLENPVAGSYDPSNVSISGGSINGVVIGNITPSTGTFTALAANISTQTTNYTISNTDYTILANATTGAFTVYLPVAPIHSAIFNIKKIDSTINIVTVDGNGKNIDEGPAALIKYHNTSLELHYNGTFWSII